MQLILVYFSPFLTIYQSRRVRQYSIKHQTTNILHFQVQINNV